MTQRGTWTEGQSPCEWPASNNNTLLYGASALDPLLIAGLSVILLFVTGAVCYLPARRASSVDPVLALAHE